MSQQHFIRFCLLGLRTLESFRRRRINHISPALTDSENAERTEREDPASREVYGWIAGLLDCWIDIYLLQLRRHLDPQGRNS